MQQVPTSGRDVFIRYKTNAALAGPLVIPDNCSNRMALRWRWFVQVSALPTVDGKVLACLGCNG